MPNIGKRKKVMFLYNPSSGKGKVEKNIDMIVSEITAKFGSCDVVRSKSAEHMIETVKSACLEYDYLLFSGGDGTFDIVVNAIPDIDNLPIFGFLPGGSTNDMGYNLNISNNIKKGIHDLLNSKPRKYDVGYMGDNKFIYVSCIGAFTDIPIITPQEHKKKWGALAYGYYGIKSMFKTKLYKITINGIRYETPLVIISNSKEVASFRINPFTKQDTNYYYAVIVNKGFFRGLFNVAYLFAFGVDQAIKRGKVHYEEAQIFSIDSETEDMWDFDGEFKKVTFPTSAGYSGRSIMVLSNRE